MADDDKGGLEARALIAAEGGSWGGLLFDNAVIGLPPALTWTCSVPLAPVEGERAGLDLDWLPWVVADWRAMAGVEISCDSFAEPAEASVFFRGHHRYDRVAARVAEQQGERIRVVASVAGDIDKLGPDEIGVDTWLAFQGVTVQLSEVSSAAEALERLAGFTATAGLVAVDDPRGIAFRFQPG
ncbi:hypothetical protein OWR29_35830 [Actinoplanes sp. Pm04-4]|uniref:Glyoxalase-like domain-containing protein n=1 Tax=Paractinoplanes pyxinae TaxID=2997416 RepID=A0ABT4BCR7_9ACTN|nr:hypothetical protein [Actinoplanes pyxinae]MCY1143398.1 hypothetical protein [Actinoplanes pyxinae]